MLLGGNRRRNGHTAADQVIFLESVFQFDFLVYIYIYIYFILIPTGTGLPGK